MNNTFTTSVSHRSGNPRLPVMIQLDATIDGLFVILNLGHWDLFEIWILVLGIFIIFIKQVTFYKISELLV